MTKQDHINYWKTTVAKDWKVVGQLFDGKSYVHALFWAHMVLEKLLKAHWVKDNVDNIPPKIHNLVRLIENTKLEFPEADIEFLYKVNQFQLEGRYPEYMMGLHKKYKSKQTKEELDKIAVIRKCLLKNL